MSFEKTTPVSDAIRMKKHSFFFCAIILIFQSFSVVFAAEPFRFALFSDLHITIKNPKPSEDLQKAVDEVNTISGLDFVLVSGDVSQNGDTESLKQAKSILDKLKIPYYVTAGNHEYKIYPANDSNFIRIFGDDKFSYVHKKVRFIGFTIQPDSKIGKKQISEDNIHWLRSMLKKNSMNLPVFIVTHYPLQKGDVNNANVALDLFQKYKVKAVLSGHYHRNVVLNYNGILGIIHRSTMRGNDKTGGYSILSVSDSIKVFEKKIGQTEIEWLALPLAP